MKFPLKIEKSLNFNGKIEKPIKIIVIKIKEFI